MISRIERLFKKRSERTCDCQWNNNFWNAIKNVWEKPDCPLNVSKFELLISVDSKFEIKFSSEQLNWQSNYDD